MTMPNSEHLFDPVTILKEPVLLEVCELMQTEQGQTVVRQGAWTDDLYVVKEGKLKVLDDRGGSEFVLATVGPGDVFGEMSFLDGSPRSATIRVEEPGQVLRLSRSGFLHLFDHDPALGARLMLSLGHMLAGRLRMADSALCMLSDDSDAREKYELRRLIAELRRSVRAGRLDEQKDDSIGEIHYGR